MLKRSSGRSDRFFAIAIIVLGVALAPASAHSQTQNSAQRGCIIGLNSAISKVAGKQQRQVAECVGDALGGLLPGVPGAVGLCVLDPTGDAAAAILKAEAVEAKKCSGDTPDFGYVGAATAGAVAVAQEFALASDIFGDDIDAALVPATTDPAKAECQDAVTSLYTRLGAVRLRTFVDCKKAGLGIGQIDSAAKLDECFNAIETDAKGKIGKTFDKLARGFVRSCLDITDIDALFPGDCAGSTDILTCIDQQSRCRTCLTINQVDALDHDCERYDNGLMDGSCIDPDADECAGENGGNNCHANASCTDTTDGFTCECDDGYEGDGVTCDDVDECEEETDNCDVNAICTNVPGLFECACKLGWSGDGETCSDLNECIGQGGGHNCDANATCSNTLGGFLCACNPGWIGTGQACIDRNECALNVDNCSVNALCTNIPGSFSCACNAGYGGNGVLCTDFNECLGQNGGHNCSINGACLNLPGSFSCSCLPGFSGNGITCTDLNECVLNTDNCSNNATCTNTIGSFTCACNAGYGGNGVLCTDFNECLGQGGGNNCSVNANCLNLPGTFGCECRDGYYGNPIGAMCEPIQVNITSPLHGIFTTATSITVTGVVTATPLSDVALTIMAGAGAEVPVPINPVTGAFSTTVPLSAALIFNGIRAEVTQLSTGFQTRDRVVVIQGQSRLMGSNVDQAVGLRITDPGFNELEPLLAGMVDLDLATLLPVGTVIINNECFLDSIFGCIMRVTARVSNPPPSLGGFSLNVDSQTNFMDGRITLNNIVVNVQISGGISCGVRISANTATIDGDYLLEPDPFDTTVIDVNQNGNVSVAFSNFNRDFTSGVCDWFLIGDIISAIVGDIEPTVRDGLVNFLADPDGAGTDDAPIAQAIEDALAGIELTGPIGTGFGVDLDTPLFSIPEDVNGITLASHARMTTLNPVPGAPTFARTLYFPQTFPFTVLDNPTSPSGFGYDMAIAISDSAFNQILAAQVERGLLQAELTEFEFVPGGGAQPITAGLLSSLIPEFGQLDPATELALRITPTLAPVLTGATGQNGEIAELMVSHLLIQIVTTSGPEILYGEITGDLLAAFDLTIDPGSGNLLPVLTAPDPNDIAVTLLTNPLGADEATLQALIPNLLAPLIPELSGLLGAFPLPTFLNLQVEAVDVTRTGQFMGVFLDAEPQ